MTESSVSVRALVVEDAPLLRKSLVQALRRIDGFTCAEAENGAEALKLLGVQPGTNQQATQPAFDIVLTDINMPIMDCLKLIAAMRAMPAYQAVPIVVITTESAEKDRNRAIGLGATRYMIKPVQAPEVVSVVKTLLNLP